MSSIEGLLLQLERDRCQALLGGDRQRLSELMHPDLVHVHATGNTESFESYVGFGAFKSSYATLQRFDDLKVRIFGDTALMVGRQLAVSVRKATGEQVRIDSTVMQVWALCGTSWRQLAYQTTPREMTVTPAAGPA